MKFEEAIQKIQYGKCLLLTGAGFSLGAKNYKQDKSAFRIAKYIAHELYNECDVPKENQDDDLRRASQWYIFTSEETTPRISMSGPTRITGSISRSWATAR